MKTTYRSRIFALASLLLVLILALSACTVQDPNTGLDTGAEDAVVEPQVAEPAAGAVGAEDTALGAGIMSAQQGLVMASQLLNYSISNLNGEGIGEIDDLLIDTNSNRIRYVTVEYGGFLDIGDRQIAVPLSAFQWNAAEQITLNVAEDQLQNFPELGADWPNRTDNTWDEQLGQFWNDLGFGDESSAAMTTTGAATNLVWASNLIDAGVQDLGFGAGAIDDLLIDLQQGHVRYAVLNYGASVLENELVALPFSALDWPTFTGGEVAFAPGVDATVIQSAPTFNADALAGDLLDPTWDDEYASYWQGQGFAMEEMATTPTTATGATTGETTGAGVPGVEDANLLGSTLLDYDFENIDGLVSGEIEDVLIDASNGRILYVTVEYGGFLEIGDTDIPLPLSAFTIGSNGELVLAFPEETLQNFPDLGVGWPDATDSAWEDDVNTFWRSIGVEPGFDFTEATNTVIRVSELTNYGIGDIGYGAGVIEDVILALGAGQAEYLLISFLAGGAYGADWVAVPFSAFDTTNLADDFTFGLDFDQTMLADAPRFAPGAFANNGIVDPSFAQQMRSYWEERGYAVEGVYE